MQIDVPIANPYSKVQKSICELKAAIIKQGFSINVISKMMNPYAEVVIQLEKTDAKMSIHYGRHELSIDKINSVDTAELKALCMAADEAHIEIKFTEPEIKKEPAATIEEWNHAKVASYKSKGVDALLRDMKESGIDIEPIVIYQNSLAEGQRLTPAKIADRFFPRSTKSVVLKPRPDVIAPRRNKANNENPMELLVKMQELGWNEEKFKESEFKDFRDMIDFCTFAHQSLLDKVFDAG